MDPLVSICRGRAFGPTRLHGAVTPSLDYGNSSNGVEFGIGRGLTRAGDSWVLKLLLMHDL